MLIQEKSDEKRNTKQNSGGRQIGKNGAHIINQRTEKKCYFCDETDDHIVTADPRGTEIIQYFACKKFVEMTPKQRFQELRKNDIFFNVYFLEHLRVQANTVMGNARDFICKNVSHDKYPTKKHVLVCHEHRGTTENEQLLLKCKNRCIMKQTKLAAF